MHDYYTESSLRASFGNFQLRDMTGMPSYSDVAAVRNGLSLDLARNGIKRSRVVSLSDLAMEALSPIYSTAIIEGNRSNTHVMTPTPTQFLFPKSVTAEQEAYASGFALALEEIYRTQGRPLGSDVADAANADCQESGYNMTNHLFTTVANCGVWQPTSVTHSSTLHYIPDSSVSSSLSSAGMNQVGLINQPEIHKVGLQYTSSLSSSTTPSISHKMQCLPIPNGAGSCSVSTVTSDISLGNSSFTSQLTDIPHCSGNDFVKNVPASSSVPVNCSMSTSNIPLSRLTAICSGQSIQSTDALVSFAKLAPVNSMLPTSSISSTSNALSSHVTVNMQDQDRWRLERKRAKNRVAAAKCQMRKLERISKLEDKARDLRSYNAQLSQTAAALHEHVAKLRKQIISHREHGCRLLIPSLQ